MLRKGGMGLKQSERQERSRARILEAAAQEFAKLGCESVTVDGICAGYGISKGMMYHYFSGRDDLFLHCVEAVFGRLRARLEPLLESTDFLDVSAAVRGFFAERERYFADRPVEKAIFENALFRTPRGLEERISELHVPLEELNREFMRRLTERLEPKQGCTREEIQRYLEAVSAAYKTLLDGFAGEYGVTSVESMVSSCGRLVELLLFGIVEKSGTPVK